LIKIVACRSSPTAAPSADSYSPTRALFNEQWHAFRRTSDVDFVPVLHQIRYWSRRIFPVTAITWVVLAAIEHKTAARLPSAVHVILLALSALTLPGGLAEIIRFGDHRAWFAWIAVIGLVALVAALKVFLV
jgi:hypothetical protein